MSFDSEKDALQKAATRQRILEAGFRIFSEKTIEKVTMTDVAEAASIGVATLYRYYGTKHELVLGISAWLWESYLRQAAERLGPGKPTAVEGYAFYLDTFLDLYRNHRDMLRFNQFFNVYVQSDEVPAGAMAPYTAAIGRFTALFHRMYEKARQDHTLRTDVPEEEMFFATTHLMLAAVTRYAVGLVYDAGIDPEKELILLKNMLLREYATGRPQ